MNSLHLSAKLACIDIYKPINEKIFDRIYSVGDSLCGISYNGQEVHITFQGTEDLAGLKADLKIEPFYHHVFGFIHTGFYENIPRLLKKISNIIPYNSKIVIEGHSKGAAEGLLMASELFLLGFENISCILFGCPNIGYSTFSNWVRKNIPAISYKNSATFLKFFSDPIPELPTWPYVNSYDHILINMPPSGFSKLFPTEWHNSQLYFKNFC